MNENYGKLSASEIREHSTGLGRMRTLLGYYMVLQGITVLVLLRIGFPKGLTLAGRHTIFMN